VGEREGGGIGELSLHRLAKKQIYVTRNGGLKPIVEGVEKLLLPITQRGGKSQTITTTMTILAIGDAQ